MIPIATLKRTLHDRGITLLNENTGDRVDYAGANYLQFVPVVPDEAGRSASGPVCSVGYLHSEIYKRSPVDVWQAPDSIVLMRSPSSAIAVCVPWGATLSAGPRDDRLLEVRDYNRPAESFVWDPENPAEPPAWAAPVVAAATAVPDAGGTSILFKTDLAFRSRSRSAALECAAELAMREINNLGPAEGPWEVTRAGVATSLLAELGEAVYVRGGRLERLPCDLPAAEMRLLLIIDTEAGEQVAAGQAGDEQIESGRQLLMNSDLGGFGRLLGAGSPPSAWAQAALDAGGLGFKATGAGASLIALVPAQAVQSIKSAVLRESATRGVYAPRFLTAVPIMGALRLRAEPEPASQQ